MRIKTEICQQYAFLLRMQVKRTIEKSMVIFLLVPITLLLFYYKMLASSAFLMCWSLPLFESTFLGFTGN